VQGNVGVLVIKKSVAKSQLVAQSLPEPVGWHFGIFPKGPLIAQKLFKISITAVFSIP